VAKSVDPEKLVEKLRESVLDGLQSLKQKDQRAAAEDLMKGVER
jgi:hypothetical protein